MQKLLAARLAASLAAVRSVEALLPAIASAGDDMLARIAEDGVVFTAGNGGSAAQALHLSEELVGRYRGDRAPVTATCLNADATALTCIANDYGYEEVFARPCAALAGAADVLIVLSTSGRSANIVRALEIAQERNVLRIGLLGGDGGSCAALCNHAIVVPGSDSAHIQEAHQVILHLLCEMVEVTVAGA